MAKKLVFSGYKFLEHCLKVGDTDALIDLHFSAWATKCEGLTEREMGARGLSTMPEWMVEVDEEEAVR